MRGRTVQDVIHSSIPPNDICCGLDRNCLILCFTQVRLELNGVEGFGFLERSGRWTEDSSA
jgi:hypothetical protein